MDHTSVFLENSGLLKTEMCQKGGTLTLRNMMWLGIDYGSREKLYRGTQVVFFK